MHDMLGAGCKVVCMMDGEWKVTQFMARLLMGKSSCLRFSSGTYDATCVDDLGVETVLWSGLLPPCRTDSTAGKKRFTSTSPHSFSAQREDGEHASLKLSPE